MEHIALDNKVQRRAVENKYNTASFPELDLSEPNFWNVGPELILNSWI